MAAVRHDHRIFCDDGALHLTGLCSVLVILLVWSRLISRGCSILYLLAIDVNRNKKIM